MYAKLILVGNLGGNPEMRYMPSGDPVTNFSMAVNRKWKNKDGEPGEETLWFRVSAFGRMAEVCNEYLSKGRQVLVEGRLRADPDTGGPRVYTRNDGSAGASFEITAQTVKFLGSRGDNGGSAPAPPGEPAPEEEEVPF